MKTNWDHLYAKWAELYPCSIMVSHEQFYLQQFQNMRLDSPKLAKPITKDDGLITWEIIKFVECLCHCTSGVTLLTDKVKRVNAYTNLPPRV